MSSILTLITAAVVFATTVVTLTRQLHFLQLNSYYNSRFFDYFKSEINMITVWSVLGSVILINLVLFKVGVFALIFSVISAAFRIFYTVYKAKTAKKKIAFTPRVRRMYATAVVISVLILVLGISAVIPTRYCVVVAVLLGLFSPFFAMAVNLINAPIEKSIRRFYINDAKKILKSMPDLKIIGLTGSYGKTSTKHILGRILSEKYNTVVTPGGFNTPMGVVITVRNHLKPDTQVLVLEMGAKNVGDIKELCDISHPDTGIITSLGPQHLNTFGSMENIVSTKFELADEVSRNAGKMYLNVDNKFIAEKANEYNYTGYSIDAPSQAKAENVTCSKNGLEFDFRYGEKKIHLTTKLLGQHNVLNITAAATLGVDMGVDENSIKYAVAMLKPTEHRLELKSYLNGSLLIDDAYNANPSGCLEAMRVLGSFKPMKRIVVTPGLVELGEKEAECNEALGAAAAENADVIILVGEKRSKPIAKGVRAKGFDEKNLFIAKTFTDAVEIFRPMCDNNTVIIFENDLPDNYAK